MGNNPVSSTIILKNTMKNDEEFIKLFEEVCRRLEPLGVIKSATNSNLRKIEDSFFTKKFRNIMNPKNWNPGMSYSYHKSIDSFFGISFRKLYGYSQGDDGRFSPNIDTMVYYTEPDNYEAFTKFNKRVTVSIEYACINTEILPCVEMMKLI